MVQIEKYAIYREHLGKQQKYAKIMEPESRRDLKDNPIQ